MARPKPITLLLASDTHCGSTIGLCPPEGVRLDDGQEVHPSKPQQWLWWCWEQVHQRAAQWAKEAGGHLWVVLNGDLVDGDHHGTAQIMSRHPDAQSYIAERTFSVTQVLKPARVFVVRGTEVHSGTSGSAEEGIAKRLGAERDPETHLWSRWHLRLRVHGKLVDVQHHGKGLGRLPHTKQNGANSLAWRVWQTYAERSLEAPALVVRSHLHQYADSFGAHRQTRALFLPSFQLKTAYVHRVAADEIADVGAAVVVIEPDGRMDVRPILFQPELPRAV
jgi:hypothetical protein